VFCGDCGTLGIKAEITLRLMTMPAFEDHASFSFPSGEALLEAMAEIARQGLAAETCAFDPGLTMVRMKRASLTSDVKTLGAVVAKEKNFGKGLLAAAKIAMGGRNFIAPTDYPLHVICEGRSKAAVDHDMAATRKIASHFGGAEIENSIAKVIRAMPFPALNSMVGPTGEAWVPIHGVCSLSTSPKIFGEIQALYAECKAEMDAHEIHTGFLFTTMSSNAIVLEPVFFWPQGWRPVHESAVEPAHLSRLQQRPQNDDATAVVTSLRKAVVAIFERYGTGHFQIGRTYPYRESRDDLSKTLLDGIKAIMDPDGVINPGVLGFPAKGNA
jgi:D-lactate dehydrogenase (cytochrome)